ncbi:MAG: hypothetical protein M0P92_05925 [Acholeplasmataceae bacterium]|nr:hypothetical protein [Acholeplasmataceae bacterium]
MKIYQSNGVNESEEHLKRLCSKSFLSLWSYPNPYKKQGKELCDLLVVFDDQILIFSIKKCKYSSTNNEKINWTRWFNKAIKKSAKQLWGAEKWINNHPEEIFLDYSCQSKLPFEINSAKLNVHLILIGLGISKECKRYFNEGEGSLILDNNVKDFSNHEKPFTIGDLNPNKTFIHVLDDITLNIIMNSLDTISDFTSYFSKKEKIFRSNRRVYVSGEENLLPCYLGRMKENEHDFNFPESKSLFILEGIWKQFCESPQRKAQIKEDEISYLWDSIIERFSDHAMKGTLYESPPKGIKDSEKILRFFASESRYRRRVLSKQLYGLVESTYRDLCRVRISVPMNKKSPFYVFLCYPRSSGISEGKYRELRSGYLEACLMILKIIYPKAEDIVGYALESGAISKKQISDDAIYLDASSWDNEKQKEAEMLQQELGILLNIKERKIYEQEFPKN